MNGLSEATISMASGLLGGFFLFVEILRVGAVDCLVRRSASPFSFAACRTALHCGASVVESYGSKSHWLRLTNLPLFLLSHSLWGNVGPFAA